MMLLLSLAGGVAASVSAAGTARAAANPANGMLDAVSCVSSSFCEAVGTTSNAAGAQLPLAEMWNGTTWTVQRVPSPSASPVTLTGVSCTSPSFCEAVGYSGYGFDRQDPSNLLRSDRLVAAQWDGATWTLQSFVGTDKMLGGFGGGLLLGVSCASPAFCEAVGANTTNKAVQNHQQAALVEAWDGARWLPQASPSQADSALLALSAVSCPTTSVCEAVNAAGTYTGLSAAMGWKAGTWTEQATFPSSVSLTTISCPSASSCEAVGTTGQHKRSRAYTAAVWNGSTWTSQASPAEPKGVGVALNGVSCPSTSSCEAVGPIGLAALGAEGWNGSAWSTQTVPSTPGANLTSLSGVSCVTADSCVAVGFQLTGDSFDESTPVAAAWNGSTWVAQSVPGAPAT